MNATEAWILFVIGVVDVGFISPSLPPNTVGNVIRPYDYDQYCIVYYRVLELLQI